MVERGQIYQQINAINSRGAVRQTGQRTQQPGATWKHFTEVVALDLSQVVARQKAGAEKRGQHSQWMEQRRESLEVGSSMAGAQESV